MKKYMLALSVCLFLAACVFYYKQSDTRIATHVLTEKKMLHIQNNFEVSTEDLGISLYFGDIKLPYDMNTKTYFLPVDMEQETWESGMITCDEDAELFWFENVNQYDKKEVVSSGKKFSLYLCENEAYDEYFVVFTGLPVVTIDDSGEFLHEEQVFSFTLYENTYGALDDTSCFTKAQYRGNTSLEYPKKGFRLNLFSKNKDGEFKKTNKNLLNMRDDDDWILTALYADGSKIRDKLCIDLWQELGAKNNPYHLEYGTKMEFVELFINNHYQGLYGLMYPVDEKQVGIKDIEGLEKTEFLYKKKYSAFWNEEDFLAPITDPTMADYRGGFQIKGKRAHIPAELTFSDWEPLRKLAACNMLTEDEEFARQIEEIVATDNAVDVWLFINAITGYDNIGKNYFYAAKENNEGTIGYFIPWDMNISWGDVLTDNEYYCMEAPPEMINEIILWEPGTRILMTDAGGAQSKAIKKWQDFRAGALSNEQLTVRIEELTHEVRDSGAYMRDMTRWPEGRYEDDTAKITNYAKERMAVMDQYIEQTFTGE